MPTGSPYRNCLRVFLATVVAFAYVAGRSSSDAASPESPLATELRDASLAAMRHLLAEGQRWGKVHAAEYLLSLDYREGVREAFGAECARHGGEPQYRIGIWRVLAKTSFADVDRDAWIGKIREAAFSPDSADRTHAVEALAKLGYRPTDEEATSIRRLADCDTPLGAYAAWLLVGRDRAHGEPRLAARLQSADSETRLVAAYAIRNLRSISGATGEALRRAVEREPADSPNRVFIVAAMAVHSSSSDLAAWKRELLEFASRGPESSRVEACQTLAQVADASDLPRMATLVSDPNLEVQAAAGYGVLRIGRRAAHRLRALDWAVIAAYAMVVLAVGWYYARRTKTRDEYLLGNRQMRPLMVGVSLFASLISTISYLAWPGEVIKYGPMMVGAVLAYPLVGLVVGWFMIPFIMRLKVTSAYEILEARLGPGVRTLGSMLFLLLRLMWMSVIVYATASKVLVPLLGLNPTMTPVVCAALAAVTIIYTAMGGLRAVVVTDVIQSVILCGAAIATVVAITVCLGGVQAWWPSQWPAHWPEPHFGYDPDARVTLFGVMLAQFTWYVCTSASDQIAIQRYLATKDAKAARTVLIISLVADGVVTLILALVGLGLLAYFRADPDLLPDGQTVLGDSDRLFSQFIMIGLPVGVSGLVVAGLLACAMSALSAGINSTCSVITVDVIERFGRSAKATETGRVRSLKYVSCLVGAMVVGLSLFVNMVEGNLLELCYKVVNLLTAPLAGLFFLAMFVPWARQFGVLVGAVCGIVTVVAISYWKELTGTQGISFLWALPLGLVVEVGVGALVSLIPIGPSRPKIGQADA
jgi:SSS family solute:Na+ symporter